MKIEKIQKESQSDSFWILFFQKDAIRRIHPSKSSFRRFCGPGAKLCRLESRRDLLSRAEGLRSRVEKSADLSFSSHPHLHESLRLFRPIRIPLLIPGDAGGSGVLGFEEVVEAGEVVEVVVEASIGEE